MRSTIRRYLFLPAASLTALVSAPAAVVAQVLDISVVLRTLTAGELDDGCGGAPLIDPLCLTTDQRMEAYGRLEIDGVAVLWNDHRCEGAGGLVSGAYTTDIRSETYNWRDMWLSIGGRGFQRNNNIIVLRRSGSAAIARSLAISFQFRDHDQLSGDDTWCVATAREVIPSGRGIVEWLGPASSRRIDAAGSDGVCSVTLQLFGKLVSLRE